MKKVFLISMLSIGLLSCKKWLDVNDNPNSANSSVPTAELRLPPILAQFADSYESAGTRAAFLSQQLAVTYAVNNNWNLTRWYSNSSSANWPWQAWYVNTAVNIEPMIVAAKKVEAYHYIGVGQIMKAWGFIYLADFYGMLPYDEFNDFETITPKFDDGSYVQEKALALLDSAVVELGKTQGPKAAPLSVGDIYNKGNVDNWIRLAYGLKARIYNHLVKQPSYDPQLVLNALAKAPQTDEQSTILQYVDEGKDVPAANKEALQYSNTGTSARVTKLYINYITNNYTGAPSGANNMEDPRLRLLIPSMQTDTGMMLSKGVDMTSDLPKTGPLQYNYNGTKFSNSDSVYIQMRKSPLYPASGDRILSTGTWYTQRGAKGLLLTNAEMRFIEAEVLFRQNKKAEALAAYKAGIKSHMNIMGISSALSDEYLASTSVEQDPAKLTLSNIMIQKYIALSYSVENWADLRRNDFCTDAGGNYNETVGVYKGWKRPSHVYEPAYPSQTDWPRRFAVPSYEINYNIEEVRKANPNAEQPTYLREPVWWDKK